jgi:DNA-binding CsgD family transcriptional regulator
MASEDTHISRRHVDQLLQALMSPPAATLKDLAGWINCEIRPIISYRLLLCGIGTASSSASEIRDVVRFGSGHLPHGDLSPRYRSVLQSASQCWNKARRPILLAAHDVTSEMVRTKLADISDLMDAPNIAIHGSSCDAANISSIFVLAGSSSAVLEDYAHVLYLLAPYLHTALQQALSTAQHEQSVSKVAFNNTSKLTHREQQVLEWLRLGKTNSEIGQLLGISDKTAKTHVQAILSKLGVANRGQAVAITSGSLVVARHEDDQLVQ